MVVAVKPSVLPQSPHQDDAYVLSILLETSTDGIFTLAHDNVRGWYTTRANAALVRILGQDPVNRAVQEVLPRRHVFRFKAHLKRVLETKKPLLFSTEAQLTPGNPQYVNVRLAPMFAGGEVVGVLGTMRILTEQMRVRREFKGLREKFSAAFEQAPYGVAFVSADLHPIMVNKAFSQTMERTEADLLSQRVDDLFYPNDRKAFAQAVEKTLAGWRTYDGVELRLNTLMEKWVSVSMSRAQDGSGDAPYAIMQTVDISNRKQQEQELRRLATHDHLTGLANLMLFEDTLQNMLAAAQRYHRKGAVLFIDLDDFKMVNDTFGHKAGDLVLQAVAQTLKHLMRGTDLVARLGGDEFAVILDEVDEKQANEKAAQVRKVINQVCVNSDNKPIAVKASVGCKLFGHAERAMTLGDVMAAADRAMYHQKAQKTSVKLQ